MAKTVPRLSPAEVAGIVALAWDAKAPYMALLLSHGLGEGQVVQLMRRELKPSVFQLWRVRSGAARSGRRG